MPENFTIQDEALTSSAHTVDLAARAIFGRWELINVWFETAVR